MRVRAKFLSAVFVAVVALLHLACGSDLFLRASAAAAIAPQRPAAPEQQSACAAGTSPLLVHASEAHYLLSHPSAFDLQWLTADSAELRAQLREQAQAAGLERLDPEEADGAHVLALCVPNDAAAADAIAITADDVDRMREADLRATTAALRAQLSDEIDGIEGEEEMLQSDIDAAESSNPQLAQDSERNNRLRQLAKRFQTVNTRIRSGRADSSDVAELTRLQEALEIEYSRASSAEQKKFKSIKQKLAGMLADMKSRLQKKLSIASDDQDNGIDHLSQMELLASQLQPIDEQQAHAATDSAFTTQQYAAPVGAAFTAQQRWGGVGRWPWGRGGAGAWSRGRSWGGVWGGRPGFDGWGGGWGGQRGGSRGIPRGW